MGEYTRAGGTVIQLIDYVVMLKETVERVVYGLGDIGLPKPAIGLLMRFVSSQFDKMGEEDQRGINVAILYLQTAIRTGNREMLEQFYQRFEVREKYPVLFHFIEGLIRDQPPAE